MDELCRLCLRSCVEIPCKLGENLLMDKLSCINITIILNPFLPSYVCTECIRTIKDHYKFRETVTQNELNLLNSLRDGSLDKFYRSLLDNNPEDNAEPGNVEDCYDGDLGAMDDTDLDLIKNNSVINDYASNKTDIYTTNIAKSKAKRNIKKSQRKCKSQKHSTESKNNIEDNDSDFISNENNLGKDKKTEINLEISTKTNVVTIEEHKCLTCFKCHISHTELIKHYKTEHSTNSNIENKETSLENICSNQNDDVPLDVDSKEMLRRELIQKLERPYNCKICGRTFASVYAIIRHGRAHSSNSLYCSLGCGYSTVYTGALRDHEKRHEKNYKYKCATCGAGFHVRTWHDQHQNLHNNVRPFVCEICGMAFHMDRYLTSHRSAVHPDAAKGVSRYSCPHCDLAFNNIQGFKAHSEQHKGKRSYLCDLCGKVCPSSEQLKRHSETHLGLKPFACSVCNKKFARKFNVSVHEKAHAGQKHPCRHCGKYFAQRSTLLRHYRQRHPDFPVENEISSNFNDTCKS